MSTRKFIIKQAAPQPEATPQRYKCSRCGIPSRHAMTHAKHLCVGCVQIKEPPPSPQLHLFAKNERKGER